MRLRVTGEVIRRDDMPAFIQMPGEPQLSGIPVENQEELAKAREWFLLRDAKWTLLE
jgi:hypothetical protein